MSALNVRHPRPGPLPAARSSSQAEAQRDGQTPGFQGGSAAQIQHGPALILYAEALRLCLLPSLGSLLPHKKEKSITKREGGGKRGKGGRKSPTGTFIVWNTLSEYLVVQSNYRLVGK